MSRIISLVLSVIFAFLGIFGFGKSPSDLEPLPEKPCTATEEQIALFESVFETETAWIASLQLENGAIPMNYSENGTLTVNPYFADFAALALLDSAEKYSSQVKAYAEWHFEHLNTAETDYNGIDGTIYDYKITLENGKVISETAKGSYDSTDSYAATFLTVLEKYRAKTGDTAYITSRQNDISRVINAMLSTYHRGLTFAKPDYEIKYLMDNCEVYEGLKSAVNLLEAIGTNPDLLSECRNLTEKLQKAFENNLWNANGGYYHPALGKNNKAALDFSWDEFYPDATAQLFPIIGGVISPNTERAQKLYSAFCTEYNWQSLAIPSEFAWSSIAYAAAIMGDTDSVAAYLTAYNGKYSSHEYPLYNADSARAAMAAHIILEKLTEEI